MKGIRGEQARLAEYVGKAGEHAVASQLLLHGMDVAFMAVGHGVDLIAANGCRIQVKTAHLRRSPCILKIYPEGVYSFHFPKRRFTATSKGEVKIRDRKPFADVCDVVVLWGVEHSRFWIVPPHLLDTVQCVFMGPKNARAFDGELPEMQSMVDMGFSQKAIGEHLGITQGSVGKRLERAGTQKHGDRAACTVRNCENAWEHILDFSAAVAQTPQEVSQNAI
jgi:hypothetical protein